MSLSNRVREAGLVLALAVAGLAGTASAKDASPFLGGFLQESRVLYPLEIGEWQAQGERRYEQVEAGASVRYRLGEREDLWMDVYFYPSGVQLEPRFLEAFRREVGEVEGTRRQQGHEIETGETRVFDAPGEFDGLLGEFAPRPRSITFAFVAGGKRYHSVLALGIKDMYYVKVRFSAESNVMTLDEIRQQGEGFLAGFLSSTRVFNTGDCWRTLSAEEIPDGSDRPDAILASANDGTDDEVWIADDRIYLKPAKLADDEAREPLLALGMNLHAALRGRCLPPESLDVEVPEGMREIRMEYRAPAKPGYRPAIRVPTRGQG